ncbi:hypothetical protein [Halorubellus sp. PRR65]|uniref:hypothetical protein n=1 Tax=Halorubellus sp. PRR65 TaxID=3098148 RepID=UPI002B25D887|nr:hypothetical protein [Halorubellus sp. PRR65]
MNSETRSVDVDGRTGDAAARTGDATVQSEREAGRSDDASTRTDGTGAGRVRRRVLASGAVAALAVAVATTLRILHNVPFDPLPVSAGVLGAVEVTAAVAVALGVAAVAFGNDRAVVRVGLLFAAVFGALATVAPPARVPAAVAVTAGGGLALAAALGRPDSYRGLRRRAVAAGFVAAVALSLASTVGVAPRGVRELGVVAYLLALAALSTRVRGDPLALVAGGVAFAAVVAGSASAPYVAGSALLVGFAVVGGPHLLVAAAVGGAVAAAIAAVRRGEFAVAVGAVVLVAAGAPATPTAAMAVVLGATLATVDLGSLLAGADDGPAMEVGA